MKRGPKPKPTALKILAGNPGKRPLPANEPRPEPGMPTRPSYVKGPTALAHWRRLTRQLSAMGVLTSADGPALGCLVSALELLGRIEIELRSGSLTVKTEKGGTKPNPLLAAANSTSLLVNRWLAEFGLTPSARPRVPVAWLRTEDDDFLDGA